MKHMRMYLYKCVTKALLRVISKSISCNGFVKLMSLSKNWVLKLKTSARILRCLTLVLKFDQAKSIFKFVMLLTCGLKVMCVTCGFTYFYTE